MPQGCYCVTLQRHLRCPLATVFLQTSIENMTAAGCLRSSRCEIPKLDARVLIAGACLTGATPVLLA